MGDIPEINNNGKKIVPGTLSECATKLTPSSPAGGGFLDLFAPMPAVQVTQPLPVQPVQPVPAKTQPAIPVLVQPMAQAPKISPRSPITHDPFDDPLIGGRVTICILMYGNYYSLHTRCLNAIISTVPASRRQLRVVTNEVCAETLKYLSRMQSEGQVHKVLANVANIKKYPAMRQLFHDNADPITDKWLIWFDDDSIADRDPMWCPKLLKTVIASYDEGCRSFGAAHIWTLKPQQREWIKSRPWYRNRPFQLRNGTEAPNGDNVLFPAGGFWAINTECMRNAGIPDATIGHNGGDYMLSEQLWQLGFKMKNWNGKKQFIHTSSVKRRGLSELHTGMLGWQAGGVSK